MLYSCKKYEEGPDISFRSIDKKIYGYWELEYLYINDHDSTAKVKEQECYEKLFITVPSKKNEKGEWVMFKGPSYLNVGGQCIIGGDFEPSISIWNIRDSTCFRSVGVYLRPGEYTWTITRLTKKQFWIKTTWNNQRTWAHFKKVEP